jgi:hypothetical protein
MKVLREISKPEILNPKSELAFYTVTIPSFIFSAIKRIFAP